MFALPLLILTHPRLGPRIKRQIVCCSSYPSRPFHAPSSFVVRFFSEEKYSFAVLALWETEPEIIMKKKATSGCERSDIMRVFFPEDTCHKQAWIITSCIINVLGKSSIIQDNRCSKRDVKRTKSPSLRSF